MRKENRAEITPCEKGRPRIRDHTHQGHSETAIERQDREVIEQMRPDRFRWGSMLVDFRKQGLSWLEGGGFVEDLRDSCAECGVRGSRRTHARISSAVRFFVRSRDVGKPHAREF